MDGSETTTTTSTVTSSTDFEQTIERCVIEALDEAFDPNEGGSLRTRFVAKAKAKARLLSMMRDADVKLAQELGEAAARSTLTRSLAAVALATEEHRASITEQLAASSAPSPAVEPARSPYIPEVTPFAPLSPEGLEIKPDHCEQCRATHAFTQEATEVLSRHLRAGIVEVGLRVRDGAAKGVCPTVVGLTMAAAIGRAAGHHVAAQALRNSAHPHLAHRMRHLGLHGLDDGSARAFQLATTPPAPPPPPPAEPKPN